MYIINSFYDSFKLILKVKILVIRHKIKAKRNIKLCKVGYYNSYIFKSNKEVSTGFG